MRVLLFLPVVVVLYCQSLLAQNPVFRAGAAAVDVTPQQFPLNMPGGFSANLAESAHDPLHARALVLEDGTTTLAMVVVDNLGVSPELIVEAKQLASQKTGIPVGKMLVSSTHTHSGPPSHGGKEGSPEAAYRQRLLDGIVASIVKAHETLRPAAAGAASHPLPEEVFNRRWYLKPGKMTPNPFGKMDEVRMNPGTNPEVIDRPAGPTDPDFLVLSIQNEKRQQIALYASYALHYVGATPRGEISADYFGEFARLLPSRLRGDGTMVSMLANGASGDINNIPFTVTRPPRETFEQVRIVAQKAADAAWFAHRKIETHDRAPKLGLIERQVELRYRRPSEEDIAAARKVLDTKVKEEVEALPRLAQHYAARVLAAAERSEEKLTVPVQAIRVGDLAICGLPFEVLVEIGLELREKSPFGETMVIGLANGRHGYLPNPKQH
ncbi:MAG: neutral/alkaline non-lysosomal ceramidase N-terminal domain-containing protein, partial [Verrucomicrobiae bacterium]|nr:neutral/alkaline non-lysosomal ceramidase N-terminal domain-containing protein [Verrucomicrobiae bacterium]